MRVRRVRRQLKEVFLPIGVVHQRRLGQQFLALAAAISAPNPELDRAGVIDKRSGAIHKKLFSFLIKMRVRIDIVNLLSEGKVVLVLYEMIPKNDA